jgi:hypothetical protein
MKIKHFVANLQTNQALISLGCVLVTQPQAKEPQISLPNKFDGTYSKFQGFVNQVRSVIQLHPHDPTSPTQVGLIGALLSCTILVWFAPCWSINTTKKLGPMSLHTSTQIRFLWNGTCAYIDCSEREHGNAIFLTT